MRLFVERLFMSGWHIHFCMRQANEKLQKNQELEFTLVEEFPDGYFPYQQRAYYGSALLGSWFEGIGLARKFPAVVFERKNGIAYFYLDLRGFEGLAGEVVSKTFQNPSWLEGVFKNARADCLVLRSFCAALKNADFSRFSGTQITTSLAEGEAKALQVHLYSCVQGIDLTKKGFTARLLGLLQEKRPDFSNKKIQNTFTRLTTPTEKSLARLEYEDLNRLCGLVENDVNVLSMFESNANVSEKDFKLFPEFFVQVKKHVDNYGFLGFGTTGPANNCDDYLQKIHENLKRDASAKKILPSYAGLESEFGLDVKEKRIFSLMRESIWLKGYRRDCMMEWWSCADGLLGGLASRKGLTLEQTRFILPSEFANPPDAYVLSMRSKHVVIHALDKKLEVLAGKEAENFVNGLKVNRAAAVEKAEFYGQCACSGQATGKVCVVNTRKDLTKMAKGDVLVSCATSPELMPAIAKASAIVTDMGGIACHAAIVSRELGIPCVIGTKHATKTLKDGDVVEVNAGHGRVRIIEKATT